MQSWGTMLPEVLLDSVIDTVKMLPFLFVAYLAIEYIENYQNKRIEAMLAKGGRFGFVPGAVLGLVPQCGFSAMAANLYSSRVITLGTLIAVFMATSDEAIPVFLAHPEAYGMLAVLLASKLVWGLIMGFVLDIGLRRVIPAGLRGGYGGKASEVDCHCEHGKKRKGWGIVLSALQHTASIYLYILLFTFLFGILVELVGQARISEFMGGLGFFQPLIAGLLGLVPNCASSLLLCQLYFSSTISFGSLLGGLCVNAGVGLMILFRTNKSMRQNFFILGLLYVAGVLPGLVVHSFA